MCVHGVLKQLQAQQKGNEYQLRVEDEKGVWEGYTYALTQELGEGKHVRGYGQLKAQPDGSMKVALQWIKEVEEKEYAYCAAQTREKWNAYVLQYPQLPLLQAFVPKTGSISLDSTRKEMKQAPAPKEADEFIAANELQIERDYV